MTATRDNARLVATCDGCGTVVAAMRVSDGRIRPIGSRRGCASCGGTAFTPVSAPSAEGDDGR